MSTLNGEALHRVSEFLITNANYEKAVDLLNECYGEKDKIYQSYKMCLLEIPAPIYTFFECARVPRQYSGDHPKARFVRPARGHIRQTISPYNYAKVATGSQKKSDARKPNFLDTR